MAEFNASRRAEFVPGVVFRRVRRVRRVNGGGRRQTGSHGVTESRRRIDGDPPCVFRDSVAPCEDRVCSVPPLPGTCCGRPQGDLLHLPVPELVDVQLVLVTTIDRVHRPEPLQELSGPPELADDPQCWADPLEDAPSGRRTGGELGRSCSCRPPNPEGSNPERSSRMHLPVWALSTGVVRVTPAPMGCYCRKARHSCS